MKFAKSLAFFLLATTPHAAMAADPMVTIVPKGPVVSLMSGDSVEQAPDIASFSVSLSTRHRDRAAAVNASNAGLAKIKAALAAKGVTPADIEQGYFSAREEFDGEGNARRRKGFAVDTGLSVKLRKLETLGDAMGAAIAAGASDVGNPQFDVENKSPIYEKLTASATAKARAKAMVHAKLNGYSAVRLLSVSDGNDSGPSFGAPKLMAMAMRSAPEVAPDLSPRPVTISVSLGMAYEMTN